MQDNLNNTDDLLKNLSAEEILFTLATVTIQMSFESRSGIIEI